MVVVLCHSTKSFRSLLLSYKLHYVYLSGILEDQWRSDVTLEPIILRLGLDSRKSLQLFRGLTVNALCLYGRLYNTRIFC